jgi:hypothetical protein
MCVIGGTVYAAYSLLFDRAMIEQAITVLARHRNKQPVGARNTPLAFEAAPDRASLARVE